MMGVCDVNTLTYWWTLNTSAGSLVQTLSPSNPITLLQMFIFGSNGLFEMTISPLKRKHKQDHLMWSNSRCIHSRKMQNVLNHQRCIVFVGCWHPLGVWENTLNWITNLIRNQKYKLWNVTHISNLFQNGYRKLILQWIHWLVLTFVFCKDDGSSAQRRQYHS